MVTRLRRVFPLAALVLSSVALLVSCQKVPLLAPSGSTISLLAGTNILPLNGTTEIIAQVIEPSGTPPQSGTLITFTTTLGSIQPSDASTDLSGRARVRFVAGNASGTAVIRAISGGVSTTDTGSITVAVGAAAVGGVTLNASPTTVPSSGGSSTITAKILDTGGNPLVSVPVTFATDAGSLSASIVTTDATGAASTTLFTSKTAKVTATAGIGGTTTGADGKPVATAASTATLTVTVNSTAGFGTLTVTPASPAVGQTVSVTIPAGAASTGASPITSIRVDWGDGTIQNITGPPPAVATHPYRSDGSYVILVTGFDALGDTSTASAAVTVTPRARPTVTIEASASPQPNSVVTFTITATSTTGNTITSITVDFGDGTPQVTLPGNAKTVQHVYSSSGTYQVTATATDSSGERGSGSTVIVVSSAAPTASFTVSPPTGPAATTFVFDASASTGSITSYAWDFGDGSTGSGVLTTRKFAAAGTYIVKLTVTDSLGRTATASKAVIVT